MINNSIKKEISKHYKINSENIKKIDFGTNSYENENNNNNNNKLNLKKKKLKNLLAEIFYIY